MANELIIPTNEVLKGRYQQVEDKAWEVLGQGLTKGNTVLNRQKPETRYAVSIHYPISPQTRIGSKLIDFINQLDQTATIRTAHQSGLHISIGEPLHADIESSLLDQDASYPTRVLRRLVGITSADIVSAYQVIKEFFKSKMDGVVDPEESGLGRLRFYKVIPAPDKAEGQEERRSITLIGCFFDDEVNSVFGLRNELGDKTEELRNQVRSRVEGFRDGVIVLPNFASASLIHCSLGRFIAPPDPNTLKEVLNIVNENLASGYYLDLDVVRVISTTGVDYPDSRGHVKIVPELELARIKELTDKPTVIRV